MKFWSNHSNLHEVSEVKKNFICGVSEDDKIISIFEVSDNSQSVDVFSDEKVFSFLRITTRRFSVVSKLRNNTVSLDKVLEIMHFSKSLNEIQISENLKKSLLDCKFSF